MPLWDYVCVNCGDVIEDVVGPYQEHADPITCPHCQEKAAFRKEFYQTWFSLQGTGWSYSGSNCNNFKVGNAKDSSGVAG